MSTRWNKNSFDDNKQNNSILHQFMHIFKHEMKHKQQLNQVHVNPKLVWITHIDPLYAILLSDIKNFITSKVFN